jgi:signal transduction histidine kinase
MSTPSGSTQFELTMDSRGQIVPSPELLSKFCVLFLVITTANFFLGLVLSPSEMLASSAMFTVAYVAIFALSWSLAKRDQALIGTHILLGGNYLGMVGMLIVSDQLAFPAAASAFTVMGIAGFLLGRRDAVTVSVVAAVTVLAFFWARGTGWFPPNLLVLPVATVTLTYSTTFVSTSALVYLGVEHLNNVVLAAWEDKVRLQESFEALKVARGTEERRAARAERLGVMARSLVELREIEGIAQEVTISLREALGATVVVAIDRRGGLLAAAGLGEREPPVALLKERIDRLVADESVVVLTADVLKQCALELAQEHFAVGLAARSSHTAVTVLVFGAEHGALDRGEGGWSLQAAVNIMDSTIIRHESERRFVQSQQMDALGRLSAGIAHDFNNLLTTIMGCTELVEHQMQADDPVRGHLRRIHAAGKRAESLTSQLMSFTQGVSRSRETLEVGAFLTSLIPMYRRTIEESIHVEFHEMEQKAWIALVPSELERILFNLLANARDAVGDHGRIDIGLEVRGDAAEDPSHPGTVVIWIQDNGEGMEAETLSRVFEPFFTLRKDKGSVGLGLSIVSSAVAASGGELFVDSAKGSGTCFEIHLPAKTEPDAVPPSPLPPVAAGRLVLLVEDDSEVRETLCEMLTLLGYGVVPVATGVQALDKLSSQEQFSLVLSDIVMPEMGGFELAANMTAADISVPIVLISGYAPGEDQPEGETLDLPRLSKPFTLGELKAVLASNMMA